jgi:hypothetical protein
MRVNIKSVSFIAREQREIAAQVHDQEKAKEQAGHRHDQLPAQGGTEKLFKTKHDKEFMGVPVRTGFPGCPAGRSSAGPDLEWCRQLPGYKAFYFVVVI